MRWVPLVVYENGERRIVGEAVISDKGEIVLHTFVDLDRVSISMKKALTSNLGPFSIKKGEQ